MNIDEISRIEMQTVTDVSLLGEIQALYYNEIARIHQKTLGRIKSQIGCRLLEEGMLIEDVSKKLNISKETLENGVNMRR